MFTKLSVENYALTDESTEMTNEIKKVVQSRKTEILVNHKDAFHPWKPQTTYELEQILNRQPNINEPDEFDNVSHSPDPMLALSGTSSHYFIRPFEYRYNQLEVVTYQQIRYELLMANYQNLDLRIFFNKHFNQLKVSKENELKQVKLRNARLREIQNELNILAKLQGKDEILNHPIIDPEFSMDETPDKIVVVTDDEISVRPYISPSEYQKLIAQAEEAERIRLAKLANDFRDRALITMMDGVLEIRWEDEIKKNPTKPQCLLKEKDPKEYDKEDLREIHEYEEKLPILYSERERYQTILEAEEEQLKEMRDKEILRFNTKVGETYSMKLKVDAALRQEELKQLRNLHFNFKKVSFERQEETVTNDMKYASAKIGRYSRMLTEVEQNLIDIRNEYESLMAKDRLLERQFKTNFADNVARSVVDQVFKIFR